MKEFLSSRRAVCAGAAVIAALIAMPISNAAANTGSSASATGGTGAAGTYVSTAGTSLLGLQLPAVSSTLPVALPGLDFNVVDSASLGGLPLYNLNVDPHMVK